MGNFFVGVVAVGTRAFQHTHFKGSKGFFFKTECFGAVGQGVGEVGARPVQYGHEIVTHGLDATSPEVAQRLGVIGVVLAVVAAAFFDVFVYRDTFHHTPAQSSGFDDGFAFFNFFYRPHGAVGQVVEGSDDAGGSGLPDVAERNRIIGAKPAPSLF